MCGIWAIFGSDVELSKQVSGMWNISHRGPDAFRLENVTKWNKSCVLGFHRLAILDGKHGMQPMHLRAFPHLRLIYNGEIYNFKTVTEQYGFQTETHCDGEVMLHLYARGGIQFAASQLDGVFAFCLVDMEESRVYLGRDTFGVRPLFTMLDSGGFLAVCSEVKGLIPVVDDVTKIAALPPGTVEEYSLDINGKSQLVSKVKFNSIGEFPVYKTPTSITTVHDDVSTNVRNLLSMAVKKRMISERRIGCLLSGGLDSSLITSLVVKYANELNMPFKVQTFSIGMDADAPDVIFARKVADYLGTEHHEVFFTSEDAANVLSDLVYYLESYETMAIRSSVGMYLLAKYIRENTDTTVVFSGEGSDELTQGYLYFHKAPSVDEADRDSRRLLEDLYLHDVLRADRCIAAHGLELRVPFLDHQFTSFYLSLPAKLRHVQDGVEKYLLRSAFQNTGFIPETVLWRPKEGFSDGVTHVKRSLYEIIQDHIETQVDANMLMSSSSKFPFNPPKTKEALYYREMFHKFYPGCCHLIPNYWIPKWVDVSDGSNRALRQHMEEK